MFIFEQENTMDLIHITNKRKHMNTVGKFYIYNLSKQKQHLRDNQSVSNIPVFDIILTER